MKISFLIPAHNEEKIIGETLSKLTKLDYGDFEVLVGLDGCNDRTKDVVEFYSKKFPKIKYYSLKSRNGKPDVIDLLVKKSSGEILVINDADWIFTYSHKEYLNEMLRVFDNPEVGGIAESFPVEWRPGSMNGNWVFKMIAETSYLWFEYQKENHTYELRNKLFIDKPNLFLTNIFRKNLYEKNTSLGDDFERTSNIMNNGYSVVIFNDEKYPRMVASYNTVRLKDLIRQKIRTSLARRQISKQRPEYFQPLETFKLLSYIFRKSALNGPKELARSIIWFAVLLYGELVGRFKPLDTKEGWLLRVKR